ncbi:flagellar export chaperone FliS [Pelagibius litoralis]|uniref:Flagellar export chaperone FliS n=1 Tax=Pelagibius litoralis TaxID=374515 RepID=A0A967K8U8_9PROT|nr:flagellar export chaperone FliS [Pelagibius litoralis]NIA69477.1 flagellar export chaperone FliS [Pelagibius litoralis]
MPLIATDAFRSEVARARPTRLVVMLYDEAINGLAAAINAISDNEIEERCNRINVVTEIVATLHLGLDMDKGGEIAEQLGSIYRFILGQLIRVNIHSDSQGAAQIIDVLKPLRDAWVEVDKRLAEGEDMSAMEAAMLRRVEAAGNRLTIHAA